MSQTSLKTKMMEAFRARIYFYLGLMGAVFMIILIQLVNLQIIQGSEYEQKSRMNMENNIPIPAARGEIYDRDYSPGKNNYIIATSRAAFNITTIPASFESKKKWDEVLHRLCILLKLKEQVIRAEIETRNQWERITIAEDVSFDSIVTIASHRHLFPNIDWEDAPVRVYNCGRMFSHVVGYIGSIDSNEYKEMKGKGYRPYQKVGKAGIEKEYDNILRGRDGFLRRIVDVRNRTEGEEIGNPPVSGNNFVLSLDYEVQKAAFEAMSDYTGAVIVLKPSNGEVLALLSKPDFDPNEIVSINNSDAVQILLNDKEKPFLNRVIQTKYPPASTFKLLTAISALETEKAYPGLTFYCPGKYTLKGYIDRDFYCYDVHGTNDLYNAIARSCSVYFYQLGYRVGPTNIMKYAGYFGFAEKNGIDLPGEIPGFIPSKQWKMKVFGQSWFDGDTINLSIGQGFITVTPLGIANFVCGIVNNGIIYKPSVLKEIRTPDNKQIIRTAQRQKLREIPLSPLTVRTVEEGMRLGVLSGTSSRLRWLKVPVAGKTGTAQTRSRRLEKFSQHAWFAGYGPYQGAPDKSVVVVVFIEYGVAGAASAVPVAERIFATLHERGYFYQAPVPVPAPAVNTVQ